MIVVNHSILWLLPSEEYSEYRERLHTKTMNCQVHHWRSLREYCTRLLPEDMNSPFFLEIYAGIKGEGGNNNNAIF